MLRPSLCRLEVLIGALISVTALIPACAAPAPALPTAPRAPRPSRAPRTPAPTPAAPSTPDAPAKPDAGSFQYKADKISLVGNAVRLEGHAQITSPQLEVRGASIDFAFKNNQVTQVNANDSVNIKVNFVSKTGGPPTLVDSNSDHATLDPSTRTLVLIGNVDGFYQQAGGARTAFAGTKATLRQTSTGVTTADIVGPVKFVVPPGATSPTGGGMALGTVVVTSRDARLDPNGVFHLVGDAHAVSTDSPNKFDVAAPEMVITRGGDNSLSGLSTVGRTHVVIDLPPEPAAKTPALTSGNAPGANGVAPLTPSTPPAPDAPAAPVTATVTTPDKGASTPASTPGASPGVARASKFGKPTRVDVWSDKATIDRATNTLTFEGNVTGFYLLAPPDTNPQRYDFAGTKAVITNVSAAAATADKPAGLKADITGAPNKPVEVFTPAFNLDMSGGN